MANPTKLGLGARLACFCGGGDAQMAYSLDNTTVTEQIGRNVQFGTYRVGVMRGSTFITTYVGRGLTRLRRRVADYIPKKTVTHFVVDEWENLEEAYDMECAMYHYYRTLGPLTNRKHPDSPRGHAFTCKYCKAHPASLQKQAKDARDDLSRRGALE